jgi:dTDP-4-dehydrorhamnose reductase
MKLLVVGASGLVGWNLSQAAKSAGHQVIGTFRSHALAGLLSFDSKDRDSFAKLVHEVSPDALFYCAGWSWVDGCEGDPDRAHFENAECPALAAKCANEIGCHFIYFSTSYVFDGRAGPYDETGQPRPLSVYGASKLAGEESVLTHTSGRALIARTMGVYGLEPQQKNFVYHVRRELAARRRLRVPNDQFGNTTFAPDLAKMALELGVRRESGIWNLAGANPLVRRSDFALEIAAAYSLPAEFIDEVETSRLRQPAQRPLQGGLRIEKAVNATHYQPSDWVKIP